jgi:hypothetical protein
LGKVPITASDVRVQPSLVTTGDTWISRVKLNKWSKRMTIEKSRLNLKLGEEVRKLNVWKEEGGVTKLVAQGRSRVYTEWRRAGVVIDSNVTKLRF